MERQHAAANAVMIAVFNFMNVLSPYQCKMSIYVLYNSYRIMSRQLQNGYKKMIMENYSFAVCENVLILIAKRFVGEWKMLGLYIFIIFSHRIY